MVWSRIHTNTLQNIMRQHSILKITLSGNLFSYGQLRVSLHVLHTGSLRNIKFLGKPEAAKQ